VAEHDVVDVGIQEVVADVHVVEQELGVIEKEVRRLGFVGARVGARSERGRRDGAAGEGIQMRMGRGSLGISRGRDSQSG
jgi:hypothetical protein